MPKKHLVTICLILSFTATAFAKELYSLSKVNYQQGLSNSAVLSIFQDNKGFMWIGTYDGLNLYDGKTVQVYRSEDSGLTGKTLLNNIIEELSPADQGCMWVSTSTGINKLALKERKIIESFDQFNLPVNLNSNSKGNTWVLVKDTLYYYNTVHHQFLPIKQVPVAHTWQHSFVDEEGCLWIFPTKEATIYQYRINAFDKQQKGEAVVTSSTVAFHQKKIAYTYYQNGLLAFIDQDSDLFLYDLNRNTKIYIRNIGSLLRTYGPVEGIVSFYGDILIAFRENGLIKLDAALRYEDSIIDPNIRIFTIYKDPVQDIVWIGTDGQGMLLYTKNYSLGTNIMLDRLSSNLTRPVRSIFTDSKGDLWFGTKGDGLVRMKNYQEATQKSVAAENVSIYFPGEKKNGLNFKRSLSEFQVFELKESRYMEGFWIGAADEPGLLYYDSPTDKVVPMAGDHSLLRKVHTIEEESDSVLWLATSGSGLCKVVIDKRKSPMNISSVRQFLFFKQQKVLNDFFPMVAEGDSLLWLGSRGMGLVKFNKKSEQYKIYALDAHENNKSVNDILSIYKDGDVFYLGTVSGLVRLTFAEGRESFTTTIVSKGEGLLNDMIHGILKDRNGFLWLSTNKGLVKYNPSNGSTHSYYYRSGVEIGEFCDDAYYACPYTGDLFFGGINGLLCLMKEKVNETEYYPDVNFQQLMIGSQEVRFFDYYSEESKGLVLHGASVSFSVSFVAPDFIHGAEFEYSYLLEGSDNETWSTFSYENVASFSRLPYGNYTLKVRYKKDVFDTEYPLYTLPISILPPWYLTWMAWVIYVLALIALAVYLVRVVRQYYRRERLIKELMDNERRNVSDSQRIKCRETMDAFSLIYTLCGQLKQSGQLPAELTTKLNAMHETALETALKMGTDEEGAWPVSEFEPLDFAIHSQVNIQELSDEVLAFLPLSIETDATIQLHLDIPSGLCWELYKNAFRQVLYYLYRWSYSQPLSMVFAGTEEQLTLRLLPPEGFADKLYDELNEGKSLLKGVRHPFLTRLLLQFCHHALKQLHASVQRVGQEVVISLPWLSVESEEQEQEEATTAKETLLLLEDKGEMVWLIRQQLAADYDIHHVRTIQDAFHYLKKHTPALFMVDTLMYLDEESKLLEYVQANRALLMKTAFIPLMTWKSVSLMQGMLQQLADAYVLMPYDALFLKGITDRVVRDKQNRKLVTVEGVGGVGNDMVCSTVQQADFIKKMIQVIDGNLDREDLGSTFIADQMAMSSRQFYRKFKEISGNSPSDFIKNYRIEKAAQLLTTTSFSIQEVIHDVGISSRSYFYKEFMRKYGQTPKDYRELVRKEIEE